MKGIEAACFGLVGSEVIELKTSRNGTAWTAFSIGVTVGTTDDGKDLTQWIRCSCFGDVAERVCATFKKGDRAYVEGQIKLDNWTDKHGEAKHGLSVSAFKVEKVGISAIGRNKPKREPEPGGTLSFAGSVYQRERPYVAGRADPADFNDRLPF
jgi:single stranded DNA-binding protein